MISKFKKIVNAVEDGVDGLRDVPVHVVHFHFFRSNLLRRYFAIGIEQVQDQITNGGRVLTGGAVEQGSEINRIDGFDDLRNERFFCCLTEFESLSAFFPDIFSSVDLECCALYRWDEGAWITRNDPLDRMSESVVADVRD